MRTRCEGLNVSRGPCRNCNEASEGCADGFVARSSVVADNGPLDARVGGLGDVVVVRSCGLRREMRDIDRVC